jgi:hypothetical protein
VEQNNPLLGKVEQNVEQNNPLFGKVEQNVEQNLPLLRLLKKSGIIIFRWGFCSTFLKSG